MSASTAGQRHARGRANPDLRGLILIIAILLFVISVTLP
jgi:hypothetical protein